MRSSGARRLADKVLSFFLIKSISIHIPSHTVFRVPTTHDVLTALFHPRHPKSHLDLLNLFLLGSQVLLFFLLPYHISRPFFLCYFAFWRAAYDGGLGWVLTRQSKRRWIVREVQRRGWLDPDRRPRVRAWIREQLKGKMGKDYSFDVSFPNNYCSCAIVNRSPDDRRKKKVPLAHILT
jgi:hypothetical protein